MTRLLVSVAIVLIGIAGYYSYQPAPSKPPNIVLISIDSLRLDHLGVYGYSRNTSPNIDAFARNAAIFDSYFATSYVTPMSETSVHTGLYPFHSGAINFEAEIATSTPTLSKILKSHGYATAAFGSSPEFLTYPAIRANFRDLFDVYALPYPIEEVVEKKIWAKVPGRALLATSTAINWMEQKRTRGEPFFVWMPIGSAHWPYGQGQPDHFADPQYSGFAKESSYDLLWWGGNRGAFGRIFGRMYGGKFYGDGGEILHYDTSTDLTYLLDRYDDGIALTDRNLKEILAYLSRRDVAKNTIVVIQSEHGEAFGENSYVGHYDIAETQTHVPLIIRGPGIRAQRISSLTSGVDIFPTLLEFAQIPAPQNDGSSLKSQLTGTASARREQVFLTRTPLWERVIAKAEKNPLPLIREDNRSPVYDTAIRTDEFKLIHRRSRNVIARYGWYSNLTRSPQLLPEFEMYNVKNDPREQKNIYSAQDPIALSLKSALLDWEAGLHVESATSTEEIQPYF